MRWLLVPLMVAVVALSGAGAAWASSQVAPEQVSPGQVAPDQVAPPSALVLVERLTTDGALAATGPGRPEVAGFVSTLPVHQPLASRVLSLAAGRRGSMPWTPWRRIPRRPRGCLTRAPWSGFRAGNPSARSSGRLPSTRVLAYPGLEAAGLFALGPSGTAHGA
jgi:hypothetical protein